MLTDRADISTLDCYKLVPTLRIFLNQVVKWEVSESLNYCDWLTRNALLLVQVIQMLTDQPDISNLDCHSPSPTLWIFLSQVVKWEVSESLNYCVWLMRNALLLVQVIQMLTNPADIRTLDCHSLSPTLWIFLSQVVKWDVSELLNYCVWDTRNALLLVQVIQMLTNPASIRTLDCYSVSPPLWIFLNQVVKWDVSEWLNYCVWLTRNALLQVQGIQMLTDRADIRTLDCYSVSPTLWIFLSQVVKWDVSELLNYCVWDTRNALLLVQVIQMLTNPADIRTLACYSLTPTLWIFLSQVVKWDVSESLNYSCVAHPKHVCTCTGHPNVNGSGWYFDPRLL
jgi:hypothetical protein